MKEIVIKVNDSYDVPDSIYALTCEEAQLWLTTIHEVLSTHDNVVNSAIQSEVSDLFSKKLLTNQRSQCDYYHEPHNYSNCY